MKNQTKNVDEKGPNQPQGTRHPRVAALRDSDSPIGRPSTRNADIRELRIFGGRKERPRGVCARFRKILGTGGTEAILLKRYPRVAVRALSYCDWHSFAEHCCSGTARRRCSIWNRTSIAPLPGAAGLGVMVRASCLVFQSKLPKRSCLQAAQQPGPPTATAIMKMTMSSRTSVAAHW